MKVDICVAIAMLLWFALVLGLHRILVRKLDNEYVISVECYENPTDISISLYEEEERPREKQNRTRNASHGRPKHRMPARA